MHALWSLKGLGALTDEDVAQGLADPSPGVRTHAIEHAEARLARSRQLFQKVFKLAGDENPRVRFRVALALGESRDRQVIDGLVRIARKDSGDRWIRNAVLSSSTELADRLFTRLVDLEGFAEEPLSNEWLAPLARAVGGRGIASELNRLTLAATSHSALVDRSDVQLAIVTGLAEGLAMNEKTLTELRGIPASAARMIEALLDRSRSAVTNSSLSEKERLASIRLLHHGEFVRVKDPLMALIDPQQPQSLQLAAIEALASYDNPEIASLLLEPWSGHTPQVRNKVLAALLSRPSWTVSLLRDVESGKIPASQVDPKRRGLLMDHRETSIQELAMRLFGSETPDPRQEVLADYQATLALAGDRDRGEAVYRRECLKCHRLGSTEHLVGPNLILAGYEDREPLLTHILDPNRFVEPQYSEYVVTDQKGRLFTGLLKQETASSITLVEGEDVQSTVLRKDIEELRSTGKSLMPEGLKRTSPIRKWPT